MANLLREKLPKKTLFNGRGFIYVMMINMMMMGAELL